MKFYLDEDLSDIIATIGRSLGIVIVSVHDLGRKGLTDEHQQQLASVDGRCVVTKNRDDFIQLSIEYFETERPHFGLIIVLRSFPSNDFTAVARALVDVARENPHGMQPYTYIYLKRPQNF